MIPIDDKPRVTVAVANVCRCKKPESHSTARIVSANGIRVEEDERVRERERERGRGEREREREKEKRP